MKILIIILLISLIPSCQPVFCQDSESYVAVVTPARIEADGTHVPAHVETEIIHYKHFTSMYVGGGIELGFKEWLNRKMYNKYIDDVMWRTSLWRDMESRKWEIRTGIWGRWDIK